MEDPMRVTAELSIPLAEVELRASRSSGPGGQHANVTASRVEAVFDVTASSALTDEQRARIEQRAGPLITGVAQDARGQARNRELALERLRERLAEALAEPRERRATKPTRTSKQRRLAQKRKAGQQKQLRRRPDPDD